MRVAYSGRDCVFTSTPDRRFSIFQCSACGFGKRLPQPDNLQKYYPEEYYDYFSVIREREYSLRFRCWYERKFSPNLLLPQTKGRLLEIGFGGGYRLAELDSDGWDVVGIDSNEDAIEKAAEKSNAELLQGTLTDTEPEFSAGEFDLVLMEMTLEHIKNPFQALKEIKRILDSEGFVVIKCSNIDALFRKIFSKVLAGVRYSQTLLLLHAKSTREFDGKNGILIGR